MSRNEIILGAVALVVVGFSLFVSLVVPRRRPEFPGNRLGFFAFVCVLLVAAMLATVEVFGAEESEQAEAGEARGAGTGEEGTEGGGGGTATGGETGGGTDTGGETGGGGDVARGADVFASAGCGSCHTLEEAGTSGTVGPNLDESSISLEAAVEQIKTGGAGMPPFEGQLAEDDIQAVAAFVVESQGR
jgi:cytochrome c553